MNPFPYILLLQTGEPSDFVLFLGRFHPLVVHLPIGFLLLAGLMEVLSRRPQYTQLAPATSFAWLLGAGSAILSVVLGLLLAQGGDYNEDTLSGHKWGGIAVAVLATVVYLIKIGKIPALKGVWLKRVQAGLMAVAVLALAYTGHLGGSLTHGSTYLTHYMPGPLRTLAGLPPKVSRERPVITNLDSAEVFAHIILPILDARCVSCHNEDKKKGDLLLTSEEAILRGGEGGDIIKAGNAAASELLRRVTLPEDDDDFMPPEGKRPLTDEQITLIEWWINQGAAFKGVVASLEVSDKVKTALERELGLETKTGLAALQVAEAVPGAVEKVKNAGLRIARIAQDNPFLEVDLSLMDSLPGGNPLVVLAEVKEQVVWLNLSRTRITDADLEAVGALPNLIRLRLDQTEITDAGIAKLTGLDKLEYLNLYGTKVSDASIETLKQFSQLRKLYLWQTDVTAEGVTALKAALPQVAVDTGLVSFAVPVKEEKAE